MLDWILNAMTTLGYPGIALLMFLENVFPPVPSELIMPLAGFLATRGEFSLIGVIIAGTIGSVVGTLPLYWLGRNVGPQRLRRWVDKHGHWLALSCDDIDKATGWFDRHGNATVLFCRLVPGVRSFISIPAGVEKMNLPLFLLYSAIGAALWTTLLTFLGRMLGQNYQLVDRFLGPVAYVVIGGIVVSFAIRVWRRKRRDGDGRQEQHGAHQEQARATETRGGEGPPAQGAANVVLAGIRAALVVGAWRRGRRGGGEGA